MEQHIAHLFGAICGGMAVWSGLFSMKTDRMIDRIAAAGCTAMALALLSV